MYGLWRRHLSKTMTKNIFIWWNWDTSATGPQGPLTPPTLPGPPKLPGPPGLLGPSGLSAQSGPLEPQKYIWYSGFLGEISCHILWTKRATGDPPSGVKTSSAPLYFAFIAWESPFIFWHEHGLSWEVKQQGVPGQQGIIRASSSTVKTNIIWQIQREITLISVKSMLNKEDWACVEKKKMDVLCVDNVKITWGSWFCNNPVQESSISSLSIISKSSSMCLCLAGLVFNSITRIAKKPTRMPSWWKIWLSICCSMDQHCAKYRE